MAVLLFAFSGCTKKSTTTLKVPLNGEWKISLEPGDNFWENDVLPHNWRDITVPGGAQIQGFNIEYGKLFVYKNRSLSLQTSRARIFSCSSTGI